jgi:hypothetical protein
MLFAILPFEILREQALVLIALLLASLICLALALVKKFSRSLRAGVGGVGAVSLVMVTYFCLVPPVARVERLYHQGHDQFYWNGLLHSPVPERRLEAVTALAALLKSSKSNVRVLVIQGLGECGPDERQIALDALVALAKDEQESQHLRWKAEYAIGLMFYRHVAADTGTEVDREPYGKMILTHGWDAAVRDLADKKTKGLTN